MLAGTGQPVFGTGVRVNQDSGPSPHNEPSMTVNPEGAEQKGGSATIAAPVPHATYPGRQAGPTVR